MAQMAPLRPTVLGWSPVARYRVRLEAASGRMFGGAGEVRFPGFGNRAKRLPDWNGGPAGP